MKSLRLICLVFSVVVTGFCRAAVEETEDQTIRIEPLVAGGSDTVEFNWVSGIARITNDFVVHHRGAVLTAHRGELNLEIHEMTAEGAVSLQLENQIWRGERLRYNFNTRQIQTRNFRTGRAPFYATGEGLTANRTNNTYTATNAFVTTDDVEKPGFRVRARHLTIVPGKYFIARHAVLYFGAVPVFYFPYYRRNFGPREGGLESSSFAFTPGYRSVYGPYLLGAYNWYW